MRGPGDMSSADIAQLGEDSARARVRTEDRDKFLLDLSGLAGNSVVSADRRLRLIAGMLAADHPGYLYNAIQDRERVDRAVEAERAALIATLSGGHRG